MLKVAVITLFPDWVKMYCGTSILGRAQQSGVVQVQAVNPRDFTTDPHRQVDDAPYGGGPGMVMMCKPILDAYESLLPLASPATVLMTSPLGRPLTQAWAKDLATQEQLIFICGHYEGVDARIHAVIPEIQLVSLGDFILTGGELAALSVIDATVRLLPGALGKQASTEEESFEGGVLEYPHYTRPSHFKGIEVPEILLSGNHAAIAMWRRQMALKNTLHYRPDLLAQAPLSEMDLKLLEALEAEALKKE